MIRALLFLASLLIFTGCESDSDNSDRYEIETLLDKGNFRSVLSKLDCQNSLQGFSEEECYLNRGMAYYGLAGYDITTVGEELYRIYSNDTLSDTEQNIQITAIILQKFRGDYISLGVNEYEHILALQGGECNTQQFSSLSDNEQQACLAINPALLLAILGDDKIEISANLDDLAQAQKTVVGIIPTITDEEIANLLNGNFDKTSSETQNDILATECLIGNSCENGFKKVELGRYQSYWIYKIWNSEYTTLKILDANGNLVLLEENSYITQTGESCSETEYKTNYSMECFPKPVENGETVTSSLISEFNSNDDFKNSTLLLINIGNSDKSDEEKINKTMIEICGSTDCEATEQNFIEYLKGD